MPHYANFCVCLSRRHHRHHCILFLCAIRIRNVKYTRSILFESHSRDWKKSLSPPACKHTHKIPKFVSCQIRLISLHDLMTLNKLLWFFASSSSSSSSHHLLFKFKVFLFTFVRLICTFMMRIKKTSTRNAIPKLENATYFICSFMDTPSKVKKRTRELREVKMLNKNVNLNTKRIPYLMRERARFAFYEKKKF
jgi:hypothetical protein